MSSFKKNVLIIFSKFKIVSPRFDYVEVLNKTVSCVDLMPLFPVFQFWRGFRLSLSVNMMMSGRSLTNCKNDFKAPCDFTK